MDITERLRKIAEAEGISIEKFDIEGAQEFLDRHKGEDLVDVRVRADYINFDFVLGEVHLSVTYRDNKNPIGGMIPEVEGSHEVYVKSRYDESEE